MSAIQTSIAKITPSALPVHFPRKRLFRMLDAARKRPIVWISAPPGSGKTTLVGSYIESRRLPCLWYKVDEGDADPATFFFYLGLAAKRAAPRRKKPMPLLTPEYLPGLPVFTRRFFEELYGRMKIGSVLVFDNCQTAPPESPLHEVIREGLAAIPKGFSAILISRSDPPPAFARKRAHRLMEVIGWKEIRLTAEETEGIARLRRKGRLPKETVRYLQSRTGGWAAGLTLLLEKSESGDVDPRILGKRPPGEVFDYFAGEVFGNLDPGVQDFLLKSVFLPRMTAGMSKRLTGQDGAGRILSEMSRHNRFTTVVPEDEPVYEYHALFREFLLARAKAALPKEEISRLQRAAADLLAERGQVEDAVALLRECGDWGELCRVILSQAPTLLAQGRFQTLGEWLRSFPPNMLEEVPWLQYWMGASCMPFQPGESRAHFEQAFRKFRTHGDVHGVFLSWSGAVDSIVFGGGSHQAVVHWIQILNDVLAEYNEFPSKEIGERVTCSMMKAVGFSYNGGPACTDENMWVERTFSVARTSADNSMKIEALNSLGSYLIGKDIRKAEMVLEMLRELTTHSGVSPMTRLFTLSLEMPHAITMGEYERCMNAVAEGLELYAATGARFFDFLLIGHGALCSMITGNTAAAKDFMQKMAAAQDIPIAFAGGFYHYLSAWDAIDGRDLTKARLHADQNEKIGEESWYGWALFYALFQRAFLSFEEGSHEQAIDRLEIARRVITGRGDCSEFTCSLAEAYFLLRNGNEEAALAPLRAGLKVGRESGIGGVYMWYSGFLETVCAKALEAGIEPEYTRELIRKNRLLPSDAQLGLEKWPWPIRIRTLGEFEILRDGKPLSFSRKVQQKPLAMLKLLLALGGKEVPEEKITDALWPETEGDLSHQSFTTTLRRLRMLLGDERAISLRDGRLSLDDRYCWTDVRALDRLIAEADREKERQTHIAARHKKLISRVLDLYRGPFLSGEEDHSSIVAFRERLRTRFLRCVSDCGKHLEEAGEWDAAISCYRKGLEVDDLAEEFYRGLMGCYGRLGRKAEAVSVYKRCRKALSSHLGVDPSWGTEAIYRSLVTGPE